MRTINFRAWDGYRFIQDDTDSQNRSGYNLGMYALDSKGHLYFFESEEGGMSVIEHPGYTIQMNTGLLDKNGKEIYEGDLVQLMDVESEPLEVMIGGYWPTEGDAAFGVHVTNQKQDYVRGVSPFSTDNNIEVIGNIWEHGDLLNH